MISPQLLECFVKEAFREGDAKPVGDVVAAKFQAYLKKRKLGSYAGQLHKSRHPIARAATRSTEMAKALVASAPTAKKADDPSAALMPKIKGMKMPRMATPKITKGTKGQVPINPFSGNWVKPASLAVAGKHLKGVGHAATGLALIGGAAHLAKKTKQAIDDPYAHAAQRAQTQGELRGVRKARAGRYALNSAPGLLPS